MGEADVILVVGANLTESHPVLALEVIKALRLGKSVVVIDPRETELATKATVHLAVKPGTDLAALRAMMRHILDAGLVGADFVGSRTEGFTTLEGMLTGLDLGVEAGTCGVDADLLRTAAAAFGEADRALVIYGSGVSQGPKTTKTVTALADLVLMTGNVGRPGTGVVPLRSGANSQGIVDMGVGPERLPGGVSVGDVEALEALERAWGSSLSGLSRGVSLTELLTPAKTGTLEVLYVLGADPVLAVPDEKTVRATLEQTSFVVVQDSFLSDTAEYADVVLPAAVATEDDGTFTNGERFVQRVRPAVPAPDDCRQDWLIVQSLANSLGEKWAYGSSAEVMREIAEVAPTYGGITHERLETEELQWPCSDSDSTGTATLSRDRSWTRSSRWPWSPGRSESTMRRACALGGHRVSPSWLRMRPWRSTRRMLRRRRSPTERGCVSSRREAARWKSRFALAHGVLAVWSSCPGSVRQCQ
jgi:predicted molibdopterin-dependent oxidoreductase YjgC